MTNMTKRVLIISLFMFTIKCSAFDDQSRRIYAARYPAFFKTFLQRTNEKEVTRTYVAKINKILFQAGPERVQSFPIIYDIGCGDGYLSGLVLRDLQAIVRGEIRYIGIDPNEELLRKAATNIEVIPSVKCSLRAQKIEEIKTDPVLYPTADMILMSQCCYYMSDVSYCINKIKELMNPHGFAIFIHVHDSVLNQFKEKHKTIIDSKSVDLNATIEAALTKAGLHYYLFELPVMVNFPVITNETGQQLLHVP